MVFMKGWFSFQHHPTPLGPMVGEYLHAISEDGIHAAKPLDLHIFFIIIISLG
jgi:hypothetical protein